MVLSEHNAPVAPQGARKPASGRKASAKLAPAKDAGEMKEVRLSATEGGGTAERGRSDL